MRFLVSRRRKRTARLEAITASMPHIEADLPRKVIRHTVTTVTDDQSGSTTVRNKLDSNRQRCWNRYHFTFSVG